MFYEQPPKLYRSLFPGAIWRIPQGDKKTIYLTFDDGPIPEVTPWVLRKLEERGVKATFFMVGDNVSKYPYLLPQVLDAGHCVGNHTFHHIQGIYNSKKAYLNDTLMAHKLIDSPLFRPPHGHLKPSQYWALSRLYKCVMWDVVTRDYNASLSPDYVLGVVQRLVRDGSIVVFHDSLKAWKNMSYAMPLAIDWLLEKGYHFATISEGLNMEITSEQHISTTVAV